MSSSSAVRLDYINKAINVKRQTDKPGSVVDNHSSRRIVANTLKQPTRTLSGQPIEFLFGLATCGVYLAMNCCQSCGGLLPHRFTLTYIIGGLFSVALVVGFRLLAVS